MFRMTKFARLQALITMSAALFAIAGTARAVTSSYQFHQDVQTPNGCRGTWLEADLSEEGDSGSFGLGGKTVVNIGRIQTRQCFFGGPPITTRAGLMGVKIEGWAGGALCGQSIWHDSTSATTTYGWKYTPCNVAQRPQKFYHTRTYGRVWNGRSWTISGPQASPSVLM